MRSSVAPAAWEGSLEHELGPVFRVANRVAGGVFVICAVIQWNDPDPLRWMAIYLAAAAACFVAPRGPHGWILPAGVALVALIWAGALGPTVLPDLRVGDLAKRMKAETPAIESSRELLGLLIVLAWTAPLAWVLRPNR